MKNVHTLHDYPSGGTASSTIVLEKSPPPQDPPYQIIRTNKKEKGICPPIVALVLLILAVTLAIIGSLSLLSWKYAALSALTMTPEMGLVMVIVGAVMATVTGRMILKSKWCNVIEKPLQPLRLNPTSGPVGHRLGRPEDYL